MKKGTKITYFNIAKRQTVTGVIKEIIPGKIGEHAEQAVIKHTGQFQHYFDVTIGCYALTINTR